MKHGRLDVSGTKTFQFLMDEGIGRDTTVLLTGTFSESFKVEVQHPGGKMCKEHCKRVNFPKKGRDDPSEICLKLPSIAEVSV